MASSHSEVGPTGLVIVDACAVLTQRLKTHDPSQRIVFSGPAGVLLWAEALDTAVKKVERRALLAFHQQWNYFFLKSPWNCSTPPVRAVLYGCDKAQQQTILQTLFPRERQIETPDGARARTYVVKITDPDGTEVHIACSVSFHNRQHPIMPTTCLPIPHVPDRHARPQELLVATADPGQLLVDALTRIKEEHSSDPALATIDDHGDSNVESVWLLYWVVHLIPEKLGDVRPALEIRLEIPSTISQPEGEADPEEDSPAISLTEDALRDLSGWLRDVSTALENHLKRLQSHNGPISLRQSFRNRAAAFGYFAEHLLSYPKRETHSVPAFGYFAEHLLSYPKRETHSVQASQAEDEIHFSTWPTTAFKPGRR